MDMILNYGFATGNTVALSLKKPEKYLLIELSFNDDIKN